MQYDVVFFENYDIVEALKMTKEEVNRLSKEGWKPQGGIFVNQNEEGFYQIFQAIIKE